MKNPRERATSGHNKAVNAVKSVPRLVSKSDTSVGIAAFAVVANMLTKKATEIAVYFLKKFNIELSF